MQETPYRFADAPRPGGRRLVPPNRGGDAGSLLLVNHWVDTSPAPRKTIARVVNAPRGARRAPASAASEERGMLPTSSPSTSTATATCFALVEELQMTDPITRVPRTSCCDECTAQAGPGRVADYIPELTHADPDAFGIVLESHDGDVYAAGDADVPFTIQSISKPFVYALAVEALGLDAVDARVGAEPSGEPFNAISLEPGTGRPANPLVNAGAILTTSLVPGGFERIAEGLSAFAGHELAGRRRRATRPSATPATATSPSPTSCARRARSTATSTPSSTTTSASARSIVTARDLAYMAATLANAGRDPVTDTPVVSELTVQHTLSVMATCGMYDGAGEWMLHVGLPAKSGVAGRRAGREPRAVRHRPLQPAAGRARQQRPRRARVRAAGDALRPARLPRRDRRRPRGQGHRARRRARPARRHRLRRRRARAAAQPTAAHRRSTSRA